jgi:hypothetical protein
MEAERSPQVNQWWLNLQDAVKEWEKDQDMLFERIKPLLSPGKEGKELTEVSQGTENLCLFAADLCRVTEDILTARRKISEVLKRVEI